MIERWLRLYSFPVLVIIGDIVHTVFSWPKRTLKRLRKRLTLG
jgi:hypothetical protein